ncbi:alpha/beta hydrolase [Streptomyces pseudovenezuelae]|uniref:alpha/beta hydrolase n=1 Tax=Streptomyces pseudovenezuelae TaxID=67350 RepID=UPI002E811424|nr:alpha/beta hydrolase [Streptomyces pseudovenezuelae]WUA93648.1 alpha/beta hydrolase [Streptomyces pseudovenezuelae]
MTTSEPVQVGGRDGTLFRAEAIAPETAEFNLRLRELVKGLPGPETGGGVPRPPTQPSERARTIRTTGRGGHELPLRVIAPDRPKGVYLHFHGGGFVSGSAAQSDQELERIARNTDLACVDVDYRLAPTHPHPAAWDDAESAALWLIQNAKSEFGTDALAIGGLSAGATLAASVLVRLRERRGSTGFQAANLVFGNFDLSMTPSQTLIGADAVPVSVAMIRACTDAVAPRSDQRQDPDLSPLFADLRDLPPALFTVGTLDPFLDDSLFMHARWIAAGNQAEVAIYPGGGHGFTEAPIPLADQANDRIDAFLRQVGRGPAGESAIGRPNEHAEVQ